jgi:hypothetical protein
MNWLARLDVVWVGLLACGCALESKSVGDIGESGSSSVDDGGDTAEGGDTADGGSDSGGEPLLCPRSPNFTCTIPYPCDDQACTADPFDDLDENGCPAPPCSTAADCLEDEACAFIAGSPSSVFCSDDEATEAVECGCGSTADGIGHTQCVPFAAIDPEAYCAGIEPGDPCNDAPEIPYDEEHAWYCLTVEVQHLVLDEATDTCASEPQSLCLASSYNTFGGELGCGGEVCTWGAGAEVFGGAIREVGPNEFQLVSIPDNWCGEEHMPLGEWTSCTDAAFGACACDCP